MPRLFDQVYAVVARIPPGCVATYGQIALHLGLPNGARTVGWAMRRCPAGLPWHRVVNAQGRSSLRGGGMTEQLRRLAEDGVRIEPDGRIDLERHRWQEI